MSDIKERLRNMAGKKYNHDWASWVQRQCSESADHIESQESIIAELRKDVERYKAVRKMNLPEFEEIYHKNLITGVHFDELVDAKNNIEQG